MTVPLGALQYSLLATGIHGSGLWARCHTSRLPHAAGILGSCQSHLGTAFRSWSQEASPGAAERIAGGPAPEYTLRYHALPEYKMDVDEATQLRGATGIICRLQDAGHQAYVVGGWVRDKFLGRPALDIDIATSASAIQVMGMFVMGQSLPRGTVRVGVPESGVAYEVTTFRGYRRDGRASGSDTADAAASKQSAAAAAAAPNVVSSSAGTQHDPLFSAYLDAAMRDFTINSLFYDPVTQRVLDFVGGVDDLQNHVLRLNRTPSDYKDPAVRPHYMLSDDPIRVLRAVRFVATLPGGFQLDDDSVRHLRTYAPQCSEKHGISKGRMQRELAKVDATPTSFATAMLVAERVGLLPHIFPFLAEQPIETTRRGVAAASRLNGCAMPLALRAAVLLRPAPARHATFDSLYMPVMEHFQNSRGARTSLGVDTLIHVADLLAKGSDSKDAWVPAYAREYCRESLQVLGAWMGQPLATELLRYHDGRMAAWAQEIQKQKRSMPQAAQHTARLGRV